MAYREWAATNKGAIQATSSIISAVGIVFAAAAIFFSMQSVQVASDALEHQRQVLAAQVYFDVQKLGLEVEQESLSGTGFMQYLGAGPSTFEGQSLDDVRQQFSIALHTLYIVYRQFGFGTIDEAGWELQRQELCRLVTSTGGTDYFQRYPLADAIYVKEFKTEIRSCS